MAQNVKTPLGEEEVLTPEKFNFRRGEIERRISENFDDLVCRRCGAKAVTETVAHPIWDGPFPMSGGGSCHYEGIPYCPNCDERPSSHGSPIAPKGSFHNP